MRRCFTPLLGAALAFGGGGLRAAPDLQRGLLAHLPFRTDVRDHGPSALPVKISGRVPIRNGYAWFEGKADWLELPFIPLHERSFAVAVWLCPTGNFPTYGVLEQTAGHVRDHRLHLMIRDGLRPWLGFYINDVVSPFSLSNSGAWQHVIFQYDGRHQQIWINGSLVCQRLAAPYRGQQGATYIGRTPRWNNVPAKDFCGGMSDFRIYGRALEFEEIVALAGVALPAAVPASSPPPPQQPPGSVAPVGHNAAPLLTIEASHLRLRGAAGQTCTVEASPDLQKWEVIGELTVGETGVVDFLDEDAANFPQRFYRLRYAVPK